MYISTKTINGKKIIYLIKSIRLPNQQIKKISKIINKKGNIKTLEKKYENFFLEKEKNLFIKFSKNFYKEDSILTIEEIEKIESMKVEYNYLIKKLSKEQLKDIFDRFIANFTYESNALEGNSLTLKDVNIVIFENISPEGKDLREIYETRNSRTVTELLLENKFGINEKDAIRIHKLLMENISNQVGYKKLPNMLIGKQIKTTPPE
mgnify:CR=1 FL=1